MEVGRGDTKHPQDLPLGISYLEEAPRVSLKGITRKKAFLAQSDRRLKTAQRINVREEILQKNNA